MCHLFICSVLTMARIHTLSNSNLILFMKYKLGWLNNQNEELTSLRWWSHFLQPYGPSFHPFSGTFCTCTFSLWFCPWPWISHRTPLCETKHTDLQMQMNAHRYTSTDLKWFLEEWRASFRRVHSCLYMNLLRYSRFNDLSQVIFVCHIRRIVIIPLLPDR